MSPRRSEARRIGLLLGAMCLVSGCSSAIRFSADTSVDADGNVRRVTRVAVAGEIADDYLAERYDLPAGGEWSANVRRQAAPRAVPPELADNPFAQPAVYRREYTVSRAFPRGDPIPSDYRRKSQTTDRAAVNRISIRARHFWFIDTYAYEEGFSDVVTVASFRRAILRIYDVYAGALAGAIAGLAEVDLAPGEAQDLLRARFDAPVEALLRLVEQECVGDMIDTSSCVEEAVLRHEDVTRMLQVLDSQDLLAAELAALFPAPAGSGPDDWQARLQAEVLPAADSVLESLDDSDEGMRLEEDILGVHGLEFFRSYPFELSLELPGSLIASNADEEVSGRLRWSFVASDFILNDRVLRAQSRVVHGDRILLGSLGLALLLVAAAWIALRGRRQVSPGRPL